MPTLSPPTLTEGEQRAILRATTSNARDHLIYSLALGTGLRLAEIVGLNVGDAFFPDARTRTRVRIRAQIAEGGRSGDVFLPDALVVKLRKFWAWKARRGEGLRPEGPLFCSQGVRRISPRRVQFAWREWQKKAGFDRLYPLHATTAHGDHFSVPDVAGPVPGAEVRTACQPAHDDGLHAPERRRRGGPMSWSWGLPADWKPKVLITALLGTSIGGAFILDHLPDPLNATLLATGSLAPAFR